MNLTPHFTLAEFRCKDGTDVPEALRLNVAQLADNLQALRDALGKPLRIVSGYRTPDYNAKCGGAKSSLHLTAQAADVSCAGVSSAELYALILRLIREGVIKQGGVGAYDNWVHYDIRGRAARWDNRRSGRRG